MIELHGIQKTFEGRDGSVQAIADLTFDIADREFLAVIGPSGSGKTTLIRILGGLIAPTAGTVTVDGMTAEQARVGGTFSYVFQRPVLLPWRRVVDNVRLPLEILHEQTRSPTELLSLVGLEKFAAKYPHELSGGMQQRVAIARALTFDPKVLLMDEPFGALDEFTRNALNLQLLDVWTNTAVTVVFITHSIAEALFLADRVLVLSERPARVDETLDVPFERPRTKEMKETPKFQELVRWLRQKLE